MAEEREVVRQRIALRPSGRRRLSERFLLRFPRLTQRLVHAVLTRRPSSRVRRTMVRLAFRWALEAINRDDRDAAFALLPPDFETVTPPELVVLGLDRTYLGREGRLRMQAAWTDELGEFSQEAEELIDTGERIVVLGRMMGTGLGSGAGFDSEVAYVLTVSEGRLAGDHPMRSHAEALEAAGLRQ